MKNMQSNEGKVHHLIIYDYENVYKQNALKEKRFCMGSAGSPFHMVGNGQIENKEILSLDLNSNQYSEQNKFSTAKEEEH